MNKILQIAICAVAGMTATAFSLPAMAQESYATLVSTTPAAGVTTSSMGTPELEFNKIPSPNKSCTETAKFYYNDSLVGELLPGSSNVQMGVENQSANAVLLAFTTKPLTSKGSYRLEVPKGFFTFNDGSEINDKIVVEWTIVPTMSFTVSPAPGYYESLPVSMTITFPEAKSVVINKLEKDDEDRGVVLWDTPLTSEEPTMMVLGNNMVMLNFSSSTKYTTKGTYALDIPAGAFTLTDEAGNQMTNDVKMLFYYIPVVPYPSIKPAAGIVESLESFELYFPEDLETTFYQVMRPGSVYYALEDGTCGDRLVSTEIIDQFKVKGKTSCTFKILGNKIVNPGKYMFKIGKSSFAASMPEFENQDGIMTSMAWNNCDYVWGPFIIKVSNATIEFVGPNGEPVKKTVVNELSELTFELPYATGEVTINPNTGVRLVDSFDDDINTEVTLSLVDSRAGQKLRATFNPPIEDEDDYVLYIPEGTITVDGESNPLYYLDITVDSTYSAIETIEEANAGIDVYRIDGTLVGRSFSPEQISQLPKGLYIVGKKKVIVK